MSTIAEYFETFKQLNVLVLGDVMIDRYLTGSVDRISPEAPVPVVRLQSTENRLGGAANVALNIKALGATPYLCSIIGRDPSGDSFQALLPEADLSTEGIIQSPHRCTTVKTRVIAQHQHLLRVDQEDQHDLVEADAQALLARLRELLEKKNIHLILLQDYNKGVLSDPVIKAVMQEAINRDIKVAVDPKKKNFWSYQQVHLFKPNLKEVNDNLPFSVGPEAKSLEKAAQFIQNQLGNAITLVTLSEKGLYYYTAYQQELVPTRARTIADVCGAGDTVFSVAGLGLAAGMDMGMLARIANIAGGQVCEKVGVVPVDAHVLQAEFQASLQID